MNEDTERRRNTLVKELRRQLKEEYRAGFEEGCKAASFVRCKNCAHFIHVNTSLHNTKICLKGHNGYETFGCTEGEPKNVQD